MNAACSGFVYGLVTAMQFMSGGVDRILLVGADALSGIVDWTDRGTCVLFGDGAGAVMLERTGDRPSLLGWDLMSDGSAADILYCDHGGTIVMQGKEVFRRAVMAMTDSAGNAIARAGVTAEDISIVVPHQANVRIIEASSSGSEYPWRRQRSCWAHRQHLGRLDYPWPS